MHIYIIYNIKKIIYITMKITVCCFVVMFNLTQRENNCL